MSVYDLDGRKALVTGGAQGLGAGIAAALARSGAAVAVGDIQDDAGKATAAALREGGAQAEYVVLDVTEDASWEQAIEQAVGALGGLDILINNAGVEISSLLADLDVAGCTQDARRQRRSAQRSASSTVSVRCGPAALAGPGGAIVNVASVAATIAFPGIAVYSATKSAVDRLTRVAAVEVRQARLRRASQLRLPRPRLPRRWVCSWRRHGDARTVPERTGGGRRGRRTHPARPPRRGR